jgi:hypothetical protein
MRLAATKRHAQIEPSVRCFSCSRNNTGIREAKRGRTPQLSQTPAACLPQTIVRLPALPRENAGELLAVVGHLQLCAHSSFVGGGSDASYHSTLVSSTQCKNPELIRPKRHECAPCTRKCFDDRPFAAVIDIGRRFGCTGRSAVCGMLHARVGHIASSAGPDTSLKRPAASVPSIVTAAAATSAPTVVPTPGGGCQEWFMYSC